MRVDVSGNTFYFPPQCACCGSPGPLTLLPLGLTKTTGTKVVHTRTNVWDIPYCMACASHIAAYDQALRVFNGAVVLAFVSALISLCAGYPGLAGFILLVIVGGAVFLRARMIAAASTGCSPRCVALRRAVGYLYWHGTHHAFEMRLPSFALEFMRASAGKLINLDPNVAQWLAANGVCLSAPGQQSARHHQS